MSGESEGPEEDVIDVHVQALFQGKPGLDLSTIEASVPEEIRESLGLLQFLARSPRREMPLVHDAVAIRLGLVEAPEGPPQKVDTSDPVTRAVEEVTHRFAIDATRAPTDGTGFVRRFDCRTMVENVLVVATDDLERPAAVAAHARSAFALSDELSAVAYSSPSAEQAVVLTYADCHQKLEPAKGWNDQWGGFDLAPLVLVLSRYFEQSDPQWETIVGLEPSTTLDQLDEEVARAVAAMKRDLHGKRVLLDHKIAARDLAISTADETFVGWTLGAQRSEVTSESIVDDVRRLAGTEEA